MNKAITDGLVLMPPPFANGLNLWSSGDGTPGSATYDGAANAAFVPADQDFGGCLELLKTDATQKLRYMGETPIQPGLYLRITARVKVVSGNLPTVRIAAWAGGAGGVQVTGLVTTGPEVALAAYGTIYTVSAIVGTGSRGGVNMPWGLTPLYGHFGLDLTGPNGGVVRIDDIEIEDITSAFLRTMMDWVDVRDYGAVGDGVTDNRAAFEAADDAAAGREVLVPAGNYYVASSLTLDSEVRFEGKLTMPTAARLTLTKNFTLPAYIDAFGGDEMQGLRKGLQALFNFSDHDSLDMGGRRIEITEPIDVQAAVDNVSSYSNRRVLRNGQLDLIAGPAWDNEVATSQASYSTANQNQLTGVVNVANIPVGSLVTGVGVGREGFQWFGRANVDRKALWPKWTPPPEMRERHPELPLSVEGGSPKNPLGPRALYLFRDGVDTGYRLHGTLEPWSIGTDASSGCIRMFNESVIDLYQRCPVGTAAQVLPHIADQAPKG